MDVGRTGLTGPPAFAELPPPPDGKTGWPWTEGGPILPAVTPEGRPWPRVSIVTPSFNQSLFIEETIRSVLLQGYPNLEYLIIDGGSTDGTREIIRRYEPWLTYWVSERDRGQAHAINKGFRLCHGEIVAWLNSDDTYVRGAIHAAVGQIVARGSAIVYGNCNLTDETGAVSQVVVPPSVTFANLLRGSVGNSTPPQPAIFFRRRLLDEVGLLDESLRYVMDFDLWLRIAKKYSFAHVDAVMANYRLHSLGKTTAEGDDFSPERYRVRRRYARAEGWGLRLSVQKSYGLYRLLVLRSRLWRAIQRRTWLRPVERLIRIVFGRTDR